MKRKYLVIFLVLAFFAGASYALGWSSLFTVRDVQVSGTNENLVQYVTKGEKLARVEPRNIEVAYKKISFVKDAQVSRNWFTGKVSIQITERVPIAVFNNQFIDSLGNSFPRRVDGASKLPTITAPDASKAVNAVGLFNDLPTQIASHLVKLTALADESYLIEIKSGSRILHVRWGASFENALKSKVYLALMSRPENSTITMLDLSAPHAPIVK